MSRFRKRATVVAGLLLSVALLWWALHDVSVAEVLEHLGRANLGWLAAAVAVATGTFVLRALRWRVLLIPVLEGSSFDARFSAVCIGFMANNLLPARLGEFARVYAFARREPVSMSATFASLVVERLVDGVILILFLLPAVWLAEFESPGAEATLRRVSVVAAGLVAFGLVVLGLLVRFPDRFLRLFGRAARRVLPESTADRAVGLLASFIAGLGALRHGRLFLHVMLWTAAVWLWNGTSFWLGFLAFRIEGPGFAGALLLQSVIAIAVSVPSSPGFFGPFEAATRLALVGFGIAPSLILSYAAGYHLGSFIPVTLLGLWYLHRMGLSLAEVERSEEVVEAEVERAGERLGPEAAGGGRAGDGPGGPDAEAAGGGAPAASEAGRERRPGAG